MLTSKSGQRTGATATCTVRLEHRASQFPIVGCVPKTPAVCRGRAGAGSTTRSLRFGEGSERARKDLQSQPHSFFSRLALFSCSKSTLLTTDDELLAEISKLMYCCACQTDMPGKDPKRLGSAMQVISYSAQPRRHATFPTSESHPICPEQLHHQSPLYGVKLDDVSTPARSGEISKPKLIRGTWRHCRHSPRKHWKGLLRLSWEREMDSQRARTHAPLYWACIPDQHRHNNRKRRAMHIGAASHETPVLAIRLLPRTALTRRFGASLSSRRVVVTWKGFRPHRLGQPLTSSASCTSRGPIRLPSPHLATPQSPGTLRFMVSSDVCWERSSPGNSHITNTWRGARNTGYISLFVRNFL